MSDGTIPRSSVLAVPEGIGADPTRITDLAVPASTPDDPAVPTESRFESMADASEQSTTSPHEPTGASPRAIATQDRDEDLWVDLVGMTLSQYQIESPLGRGSMGRVYRARHLELDRVCALKIMDSRLLAQQPGLREQFWAEGRAAANLVHPHVVTVHNLGHARGYHFIEMEFVPGAVSLRESVIRRGPFELAVAARLVRQIVLALAAAHRSGLVHRDVKPANVLLTSDRYAKLADFGLVQRLVGLSSERLAGTPSFMAPELFQGAPASARSDIYAVGVMIFYLVSGRLPYSSDSIGGLIRLHQSQPAPDIRQIVHGLSERFATIVERCLAKAPQGRYASAQDLADDLQLVIQELRDTETLVRESLHGLDSFLQGSRDSFRIILPQNGGLRLQEVLVEVNEARDGDRYLTVFSVCGPADPAYFASALSLNARLTYGSLSIRNVLGRPMFVMSRTFPRDRVRPRELRDAILEIARRSDQIEHQLTRQDLY
jgi:serine/threonine-protein kinase